MSDTATRLCHVLVADDEPHIGRIIKMKLEQGPFKVSLAYDGAARQSRFRGARWVPRKPIIEGDSRWTSIRAPR